MAGTSEQPQPSPSPGGPDGGIAHSLDRGTPGRSADAEYRRRRAQDELRRRERFGWFAWLAELLAGERQSTRAWSTGAGGERRVAAELERTLGSRGIVLHDRRIPGSRANIDHLVVAPSGVWVVDAKAYRGRVERRDVGEWFRTDVRLYVGRRDRSKALDGARWQRETVRRVLEHELRDAESPTVTPTLPPALPLHASICLIGAEWPWLARPFSFDGVWVASPRRLGKLLLGPALLDRRRIEGVAEALARCFPVR